MQTQIYSSDNQGSMVASPCTWKNRSTHQRTNEREILCKIVLTVHIPISRYRKLKKKSTQKPVLCTSLKSSWCNWSCVVCIAHRLESPDHCTKTCFWFFMQCLGSTCWSWILCTCMPRSTEHQLPAGAHTWRKRIVPTWRTGVLMCSSSFLHEQFLMEKTVPWTLPVPVRNMFGNQADGWSDTPSHRTKARTLRL